MPVQIADVVVPEQFTQYITENSVVSTAFANSGVMVQNGVMASQLEAGAESFTVPVWGDIQDNEANISTDNPGAFAFAPALASAFASKIGRTVQPLGTNPIPQERGRPTP